MKPVRNSPAAEQTDSAAADARSPYSVSPVGQMADDGWTTGAIDFDAEQIRIHGDTELPHLCIHTGTSEDLVQRQRSFYPVTPAFQWFLTAGVWIIVCVAWLPKMVVAGLVPVAATYQDRTRIVLLFSMIGIGLVRLFLSRRVKVTWYLRREDTLTGSNWRWFGVLAFILALVGVVMTLSLVIDRPWLPLVTIVCVGASTPLVNAIKGQSLTARSTPGGQIYLQGHSPAFVLAWAGQIDEAAAGDSTASAADVSS